MLKNTTRFVRLIQVQSNLARSLTLYHFKCHDCFMTALSYFNCVMLMLLISTFKTGKIARQLLLNLR